MCCITDYKPYLMYEVEEGNPLLGRDKVSARCLICAKSAIGLR